MKNRLKKKDIVLMIIILVVAGSCVLLHRIIGEKSADYITVKVNGKIEGVYSLADDQEIVLNNGRNVLKIKNGEADMIRADCPDQLCVKQKAVSKNKESIICLPNKIIVEVDSHQNSQYDAVSN